MNRTYSFKRLSLLGALVLAPLRYPPLGQDGSRVTVTIRTPQSTGGIEALILIQLQVECRKSLTPQAARRGNSAFDHPGLRRAARSCPRRYHGIIQHAVPPARLTVRRWILISLPRT